MNHFDIVQRLRAQSPPDTSSVEGILAFLLKVIGALPRDEGGGLLRKDAGENIAWYAPRNCNVSISRVCYPNGKIWKVLTDAGPGGQNGAGWGDDGYVETSRYLEIVSTEPIPDPRPVELGELTRRVGGLESTVDRHATELTNHGSALDEDRRRLKTLEDAPPPTFELPALIVKGNTSRVFGHGHAVELTVERKQTR